MNRRSEADTPARLLVAFLRQRTWSQAELAREVGIEVRAVRRRLNELRAAGVPLEDDEDRPHVYWSVPKRWFPGGAAPSIRPPSPTDLTDPTDQPGTISERRQRGHGEGVRRGPPHRENSPGGARELNTGRELGARSGTWRSSRQLGKRQNKIPMPLPSLGRPFL